MQILKNVFFVVLIFDFLSVRASERLPLIEPHMRALFSDENRGGRIITMHDIRWFDEMAAQGRFKQYLDSIIPRPDLTHAKRKELYDVWLHNPLGFADSIFINTVFVGVNVADDICNRFLNVSCDSQETCDRYIEWLHVTLLPTIELLFQERIAKIISIIELERNRESGVLALELDTRSGREYVAEREINDAVSNQQLVLIVAPIFGLQSSLFESRALRWVSYTACAGLTVTLLYKYFAIVQKTKQKLLSIKAEKRWFAENIAKLNKKSLPVAVLDHEARGLIEALRLEVQHFAQRTADQFRVEIREEEVAMALLAQGSDPVRRSTFRALTTGLTLVNAFTRVVGFVKKS